MISTHDQFHMQQSSFQNDGYEQDSLLEGMTIQNQQDVINQLKQARMTGQIPAR